MNAGSFNAFLGDLEAVQLEQDASTSRIHSSLDATASLVRKSVSSRCVALSSRLTVASSTWLWASAASVLARLASASACRPGLL